MFMSPLFSIIIPHKEIPDLLMRCLKSIPVSEDIQVIVVDDNSSEADVIFFKNKAVLSDNVIKKKNELMSEDFSLL